MKAEEIKKLSNEEIISKIKADKEELFNLRFQLANGQLEKPSCLKDLRREVARLKTELRERELNK
jgi:ribosomal protein L29